MTTGLLDPVIDLDGEVYHSGPCGLQTLYHITGPISMCQAQPFRVSYSQIGYVVSSRIDARHFDGPGNYYRFAQREVATSSAPEIECTMTENKELDRPTLMVTDRTSRVYQNHVGLQFTVSSERANHN